MVTLKWLHTYILIFGLPSFSSACLLCNTRIQTCRQILYCKLFLLSLPPFCYLKVFTYLQILI